MWKNIIKMSIKILFLYEKQKKEKGKMKKLMKSVLACLLAFAMVLTGITNQKQLEKALKNGAANIVKKVTQELMNREPS